MSFTLDGVPHRHTVMLNGSPLLPTPANIKYAHRLAAEIRDKIRHGAFSLVEYFPASGAGAAPMSVAQQLETWIGAQRIERSTLAGYSSAARFWTARMGSKPVRALKHSDILTALASRPDLSGKTVNNYVSVLRESMQLAVLDGLLPSNPVSDVPRAHHQRPPPDPFSRDEAEAVIADMLKHYPEPVALYCEFKFFTGLRTGESFGLRWPSVDLASGRITVSRSIVRGHEKDSTKTNTARTIHLNSRALGALLRQRKHTQVAGAHVWLDPRYGTPWLEERAFRRSYWAPTLKRLGIRYRQPYNTRHTYATMLLMAGRTPAWCARELGHSVEMFLRTYTRWISGGQDGAELLALEGWLSSPEHPQERGRQ